jgi:hypothetical protein
MFYLHGKIIEDQGLPAISPEYGEYQYQEILKKLASHGFVVISEQRPRNTDAAFYAARIAEQIALLIEAGVRAGNITVVGALKGAAIAAISSNLAKNPETNFVLMGYCAPDEVEEPVGRNIWLYGNVLTISDSAEALAGPCEELFRYSEGRGLARHEEIFLPIGTGHGMLYQPSDEWVLLAVRWAQGHESRGLTNAHSAALASLQKIDDYPLYTMYYSGPYTVRAHRHEPTSLTTFSSEPAPQACTSAWGCSLFAALGDEENRLLGRNFDWELSPALLLFTDPPDGYASVSMVDIEFLGFDQEKSRHLLELPLDERKALLDAPSLPFDGMNEMGLAVGMAAVPSGDMSLDPQKDTIGELGAIREILDHAATVQEAVEILGSYNIIMGEVPIHYMVASRAGDSAVIEFYDGNMHVFRNRVSWQAATNFLLASVNGDPRGQCWRYDTINKRLAASRGGLSAGEAMRLLEQVQQDNTQWSIVYGMTRAELQVRMGRAGMIHLFRLE